MIDEYQVAMEEIKDKKPKIICKRCGNKNDFIKEVGNMWFCGNGNCRQMINSETNEQFEGNKVLGSDR